MIGRDDVVMTTKITYQLNAYFGIFYPVSMADTVMSILEKHAQFKPLARANEIRINNHTLFASTNSDRANATLGFIAVDEMVKASSDYDSAGAVYLNFEPAELDRLETRHRQGIEAVTAVYEYIIKCLAAKHQSGAPLHYGWRVLPCEWTDMNN